MEVAGAELDLVSSTRGSWVFGGTAAHGWLRVTDAEGGVHSIPVRLGGPSFGVMFGFDQSIERTRWHTTTELSVPDHAKGQHLVGWYGGNSTSGAFVLGRRWRTLRNRHDVRFEETGPVLGFSMWLGWDAVWVRPMERGELVVAPVVEVSCVQVAEPLPDGVGYVPAGDQHLFWAETGSATVEQLDAPMTAVDAYVMLVNDVGPVPFTVASFADCHVLAWQSGASPSLDAALGQVTVAGQSLPLPSEHDFQDLLAQDPRSPEELQELVE